MVISLLAENRFFTTQQCQSEADLCPAAFQMPSIYLLFLREICEIFCEN